MNDRCMMMDDVCPFPLESCSASISNLKAVIPLELHLSFKYIGQYTRRCNHISTATATSNPCTTINVALDLATRFNISKPGRFPPFYSPTLPTGGFESCAHRSEDQSLLVLQCEHRHRRLGDRLATPGWFLSLGRWTCSPVRVVVEAFCTSLTSVLKKNSSKGSDKTSNKIDHNSIQTL